MMTCAIGHLKKAALCTLLMIASTTTGAERRFCLEEGTRARRLYPSKDSQAAPKVFVAGDTATTIRFETPCDPSRTKLVGGEGRFEPLLVGGKSVVIVPLRDLEPEDRFILLVTLMDDTQLAFTVTASQQFADWQVDVFLDPDSSKSLRVALEAKKKENEVLREENRRLANEENSIDHALAALLANGQLSMTPFKDRVKWTITDKGFKVDIILLEGGARAAVLFLIKNLDERTPWRLEEARLSTFTTGESRPFALRMTPIEIPPGKTGTIALVTDLTSFMTKIGTDKLVVELFRDGGLRQVYAVLEKKSKP
ncbi:DUF2381 family protein [Archangium lipolyticum]|uniref:DUF2381 family protein n=1 Tax=Archangium lipolyticum TaxID=2970465 RepID=UPI00214A38F9|nr:DUF2381 family protein [Archangium lipolyticum]